MQKRIITIFVVLLLTLSLSGQEYTWSHFNSLKGGLKEDIAISGNGYIYVKHPFNIFRGQIGENPIFTEVNDAGYFNFTCFASGPDNEVIVGSLYDGISWSTNNGNTWDYNPLHMNNGSGAWVMATGFSNDGKWLLVEDYNGGSFAWSANEGNNWTEFIIPGLSIFQHIVYPTIYTDNDNAVYISTSDGIQVTTDLGTSWNKLLSGQNTTCVIKDSEGAMFSGVYGQGIKRSFDNGQTWEDVNTGLTSTKINTLQVYDGIIYAGSEDEGLFISNNSGDSWEQNNTNLTNFEINELICYPAGNEIVAATGMGIFSFKTDEQTWYDVNGNLEIYIMSDVATDNNNNIYVVAYASRSVLVSQNSGATWFEAETGIVYEPGYYPAFSEVDAHPLGSVFASTGRYGIVRSSDGGLTWEAVNNGLGDHLDVEELIINDDGVMLSVNKIPSTPYSTLAIFRSYDEGDNWEQLEYPEYDFMIHGEMIFAGNNTVVIVATGFDLNGYTFVSDDFGTSWETKPVLEWEGFYDVEFHNGNLYAEAQHKLFFSDNMGTSYTDISYTLNCFGNDCYFGEMSKYDNRFFIEKTENQSSTLFYSEDNGNTWTDMVSGLPAGFFGSCLYSGNNGDLYLGTYDDGLYTTGDISTGTNVSEDSDITLISPNPAHDYIKIETEGDVQLISIYSSDGRLFFKCRDISAGQLIDVGGYPSGVYFVTILSENDYHVEQLIKK